uniref:DUF7027 domain-containing protein n=1 Tax=Acrobeloides nanus TaxID=290746 RepID=A0A914DP68_9BILA
MDFDPHHSKWQCCCCHLASGLKILGLFEIALAVLGIAIAGVNLVQDLKLPSGSEDREIFFLTSLIVLLLLIAVTSILMIYGIKKHRFKFMYPTLLARVLLIIFVAIFGVSMVVQPGADEEPTRPTPSIKSKQKVEKPQFEQSDPPMALRLVFLVFLMIFISIGVFYTIYLVVRCMRYVKAYERLERRRSSVIMAGQIDPELLMARRSSRTSHISNT